MRKILSIIVITLTLMFVSFGAFSYPHHGGGWGPGYDGGWHHRHHWRHGGGWGPGPFLGPRCHRVCRYDHYYGYVRCWRRCYY